ncbi:hypothetical protein EDB89DRAFT_2110420 [Lactarius sanguifluus]|nr:hypothetical protein EDB89DRAFT_2110420 [Lactarius sanguifluus]
MTSKKDEKRARNFIESFKALSLVGQKRPDASFTPTPRANDAEASSPRPSQRYPYPGGFVGGSLQAHHLPSPSPLWQPHTTHASMIPPPPVMYGEMPIPQHTSLTMQHAIAGSLPDTPPPPFTAQRPGADPSNSRAEAVVDGPRPNSVPPPVPPREGPRTPQPPKVKTPQTRLRAQSEPPSPTSTDGNAGKRCRNRVKPSGAQAHTDSDVFCRIHAGKMGEPSGFYDRKTGQTFIKFSDWVPEYLQPATQIALRAEMQKARCTKRRRWLHLRLLRSSVRPLRTLPNSFLSGSSTSADPDEKKLINLKVGRATNLNRRMDQWGKQSFRGFWPGGMGKEGVPMKGLVQAGPKGPWCHRLERLVHIELADLATSAPYLEAGYPNVGANKEADKGSKRDVKKCPDCSTMHKEIFTFEKAAKGRYKGKEWESIVKPVIEKWGGFVEAYL